MTLEFCPKASRRMRLTMERSTFSAGWAGRRAANRGRARARRMRMRGRVAYLDCIGIRLRFLVKISPAAPIWTTGTEPRRLVMQIDNSQLSLEMSQRFVNVETGQGAGRALAAGAGAGGSGGTAISAGGDQVEISGAARSAAIGGRDDLQQMDPVERLAAMALEAMVGHRVRWLGFRPPVAIGDEGPEVPQAA